MPKSLSKIAMGLCCVGYAALNAYSLNNSAVSTDASEAVAGAQHALDSTENSQALFGAKSEALSSLQDLADECSIDNWDGYDSNAVNGIAVWNAQNFIRALPSGLPLPEFAADPDGSISLDWIASRHSMISISIGAGNRLAYAWLDGSDKGHGVASFDGSNISSRILDEIRRTIGYADTSIRAA